MPEMRPERVEVLLDETLGNLQGRVNAVMEARLSSGDEIRSVQFLGPWPDGHAVWFGAAIHWRSRKE